MNIYVNENYSYRKVDFFYIKTDIYLILIKRLCVKNLSLPNRKETK